MIKLIFVDVDNTLLDFNKCSEYSMRCAMRDYGTPFEDGMFEVFTRVNNRMWQEVEKRTLTVQRLFEIRWNIIFDMLGIKGIDGPEFERQFHVYLNVSDIPVDGAKDALEYLASKYRICVASNSSTMNQSVRLRATGMLDYIEKMFISEELGVPKPQKEFFDACFKSLGDIHPDETLMLGDSLTADIDGARAYGMKTCWYNHNHAAYDKSAPPADFVIENMRDIKNIL